MQICAVVQQPVRSDVPWSLFMEMQIGATVLLRNLSDDLVPWILKLNSMGSPKEFGNVELYAHVGNNIAG